MKPPSYAWRDQTQVDILIVDQTQNHLLRLAAADLLLQTTSRVTFTMEAIAQIKDKEIDKVTTPSA
jgi:hypothetical protein